MQPACPSSFLTALLILLPTLSGSPVIAAPTETSKVHYFQEVSRWPGYKRGPVVDISVWNNLALLAASEGGLVIVDITNPGDPKILSRFHTAGAVTSVAARENRAYAADSARRL